MEDQSKARKARNETLFRQVNESIEDAARRFHSTEGDFLCECSIPDCTERIALPFSQYENIRDVSTHFLVVEGHEDLEIERVVARKDNHLVIEKIGVGVLVAEETDPRRRSKTPAALP